MPCLFPPSRSRPHSNMAQSVSAHAPSLARASHPRARDWYLLAFSDQKRELATYLNGTFTVPHRNNTEITLIQHFCWLSELFFFKMWIEWTIKTLGRDIKRLLTTVITCSGLRRAEVSDYSGFCKLLWWTRSIILCTRSGALPLCRFVQ